MRCVLVLLLLLVLGTARARANLVTGTLTAELDSGSLAGTIFPVTFRYNSTDVNPVGESFVTLQSFDFVLLGVPFTRNDISQGGQAIFEDGVINNVTASFQGTLPPNSPVNNITFGFGGPGVIGYIDLANQFGSGTFTFNSVPKPSCQVSSIVNGPPKQLIVAMQDTASGLASINLEDSVNASVSVPAFSPGTTNSVLVTATKVDQAQSSEVTFQVTDVAGNSVTCDPTDFTLTLDGLLERHVFRSVSPAEHYIRITNGTPGVQQMTFLVNGHSFPVPALHDGETYSLDIGSAMLAPTSAATAAPEIAGHPVAPHRPGQGANDVVMYASGQRGSSAYVLIGDASVLGGSTAQAPR